MNDQTAAASDAGDRRPDADLVEMFLNGHCAAYAIAAARALRAAGHEDVGISILVDENGEPNSQDDRCVFHAYASCGTLDADAGGVRTPEEMADEYGLEAYSVDGPFPEEDFRSFFCDEDCLDLDPHSIEVADDLLARRPDLIVPAG